MIRTPVQIRYNDHLFILLAIPFIAGVNYYLTYSNIHADSFFIITFVLDTLEGYCAWYAARAIIIYLDGRFHWQQGILKRLAIQIPIVAVTVVGILTVLTELVNAIYRDEPVDISFYTFDIFLFFIWSLLINSIYLGMYLFKVNARAIPEKEFIVSKNGNVQKVIYIRDIQLLFVENECILVFGDQGKQVLTDYTLEKLEKILDRSTFFRANRQCILTKKVIEKVAREKDGKLNVSLKKNANLPDQVTISRLKAQAFRQWIRESSVS
jgi:hypothetical protein